jgi:hypothetical protein
MTERLETAFCTLFQFFKPRNPLFEVRADLLKYRLNGRSIEPALQRRPCSNPP